jgi:tetratricopeptide (TPR) repeat protein
VTTGSTARGGVPWTVVVVDALALLAVLAVLGVGLAARYAGSRQPAEPDKGIDLGPLPRGPGAAVRDLPLGLPAGTVVRGPEDARALAVHALGAPGGASLIGMLTAQGRPLQETAAGGRAGYAPFPYRYPALERLLDRAPGRGETPEATALGAALEVLAARPRTQLPAMYDGGYSQAAPAAFAVLLRARDGGDCAAQLDLLLLLAADLQPRDDVVRAEAARATAMCPGDPTPTWLLAQFQSQRAQSESPPGNPGDPVPGDAFRRAVATSDVLLRRFPGAVAAETAAGDVHLRAGLVLLGSQPFTARQELRTAGARYRRAGRLGAGRDADLGLARTLTALGDPEPALAVLGPPPGRPVGAGPALELLTTAQEAAHRFAAATGTARQLARWGAAAYPQGAALYPVAGGSSYDLVAADALVPLSTGIGRLSPLAVDLQPEEERGGGASVDDLGFIPQFRDDFELTGSQPSCAELTWRRDALLAGRPQETLDGLPTAFTFTDVRPDQAGGLCRSSPQEVRAVAEQEAGRAASHAADGTLTPDAVTDIRQNLWRWAGDLAHAERIVREWMGRAGPDAFLPALRLGEVEFLQHRYDDAAADFGVAVRRRVAAVTADPVGDEVEADRARLDRGAALLAAGRRQEATDLLRRLDEDAQHSAAAASHGDPNAVGTSEAEDLALVSFHARAQLAGAERLARAWRASAEDYTAAGELLPSLQTYYEFDRPRLGAFYDDRALTQLALGRLADARDSITRALRTDPADPVFLTTAGFIADRSGRTSEAVRDDAAALDSDPRDFTAAHDLGVELARLHEDDRAVAALRRAVAARPTYALGWFDLGVLSDRMGPQHLLTSQGALARAFQLDPALRDRQRRLAIDQSIYETHLDLSKQVPPHWSLAQVHSQAPAAAAGLLAACTLALGLGRAAGAGDARDVLGKVVEPVTGWLDRLPVLRRLTHPGWALAATTGTFALAEVRHLAGRTTEVLGYGVGVLLVAWLAVRARSLVAHRLGQTITQTAWGPGLLFGMAAGAAALPWAPLPAVDSSPDDHRVHWAAPAALALLGLPLLLETALLDVPLTRLLATATVVMAASVLTPVEPLDGKRIGTGSAVASAGVLGAAALLALGLV